MNNEVSSSRTRISVGLTGGIGAGKSLALREFARQGAHTISLDGLAHELEERGRRVGDALYRPQRDRPRAEDAHDEVGQEHEEYLARKIGEEAHQPQAKDVPRDALLLRFRSQLLPRLSALASSGPCSIRSSAAGSSSSVAIPT